MPKSNRPSPFGQRGGTVTVIEQPVMRSFMRKAKIVFWITWVAVTLLAAVIIASKWEPILALLAGAVLGLIIASIAASVVAAWPVIRVIWWWLPELSLTTGLVTGWVELASHTDLVARLVVTASVVGIPAAIRPVRRCISALAWCLIDRHRMRTCFNEFIIGNRTGSLPLILGARPTPAGTRLWAFLRPGMSLADIQDRADKLAAGCWAISVIAELASASNSALVRIDIKRRDPLTGTIESPLKAVIGDRIPRGMTAAPPPVPVDLDLTDVLASDVTTPARNGTAPAAARRPQWPASSITGPAPASESADDNLADWI
jgi:hypothetical protein